MSFQPHLTVAAVVEREGRFLMVEEAIGGQLVLNQPAGHVEDGESLLQAVIRETLEETAWEIRPDALVGFYRWRTPSGLSYFRACFSARALAHQAGRALDPDISAAVWLDAAALAAARHRHRSPLVQRCLDDYLAGCRYPLELLQDLSGA